MQSTQIVEFVNYAERIAAGPYRYWTGNGRCDPERSGYADCSGLVVASAHRVGVPLECTGSFALARMCHAAGTGISQAVARGTRGALVWKGVNEGQGGIPGVDPGHVGISRGDGTTVEARNPRAGILVGPFDNRGWDYTALPPWFPATTTEPPTAAVSSSEDMTVIYKPGQKVGNDRPVGAFIMNGALFVTNAKKNPFRQGKLKSFGDNIHVVVLPLASGEHPLAATDIGLDGRRRTDGIDVLTNLPTAGQPRHNLEWVT